MAQTVRLIGRSQREFAHMLIDKAPQSAIVTIRKPNRSLEQNAHLWALLSDVSRFKPEGRLHTPEIWKSLFMNALGYEIQFEVGLNGEPFPLGFKSSKMTVEEMSDLITFIIQWGDEKGVKWSEPANTVGRV